MSIANKEEMKQQAIKQMKELQLNNKIIEEFNLNNKIYKSIDTEPHLLEIDQEEQKIIQHIEELYDILVYHIINVNTEILVEYEILYVDESKAEWQGNIEDINNGYVESCTIIKNVKLNKQIARQTGVIGIESNNR